MKYNFLALVALLVAQSATANVVQSVGEGSAVTSVNASADFENMASLNANPYSEGGLLFSRTNLSFNNNGCGYSGCSGHTGFNGFTGNYMYGTGTGGSFSISALGAALIYGLEFKVGSGYGVNNTSVGWQAFLGGNQVGAGSIASFAVGQVIGFASATGFDELRYTDLNGFSAPAFDSVRAQLAPATVPVPGSVWLFGSALIALLGFNRPTAVIA